MAPPTMAIFVTPDPFPVRGPSSATPRLKMVGNMIELNKPTARIVHMAVCKPNIIEDVMNAGAQIAHSASRYSGLKRRSRAAPRKHPMIAPAQQNGQNAAAVLADAPAVYE